MRYFIHGNPYPQPRPRSRAVKDKASGRHRAQTYGFAKDHPITVWRAAVGSALDAWLDMALSGGNIWNAHERFRDIDPLYVSHTVL